MIARADRVGRTTERLLGRGNDVKDDELNAEMDGWRMDTVAASVDGSLDLTALLEGKLCRDTTKQSRWRMGDLLTFLEEENPEAVDDALAMKDELFPKEEEDAVDSQR